MFEIFLFLICALSIGGQNERDESMEKITRAFSPFRVPESDLMAACDLAEQSLKIFVYENPVPHPKCVEENSIPYYFQLELLFPKYFKGSVTYTANPDEADFFLVAHDLICSGIRGKFITEEYQREVFEPVWSNFKKSPHFQRNQGRDHIFVYVCDNGVFCDPKGGACELPDKYVKDIENMIMVGYYGMTRIEFHTGTMDEARAKWKDGCFRINHDIVIPQLHNFDCEHDVEMHREEFRDALTFYTGSYQSGYECSPGYPLPYHTHALTLSHTRAHLISRRVG